MLFPISDDDRQPRRPGLRHASAPGRERGRLCDPARPYPEHDVRLERRPGRRSRRASTWSTRSRAARPSTASRTSHSEPGPGGGAGAPFIYITLCRRCSCTAVSATSAATCSTSGSSATTWSTASARVPFLVFYLASGLAATFTQIALDPDGIIPNLGASGAISGVMGAYLVLFPAQQGQRHLLSSAWWPSRRSSRSACGSRCSSSTATAPIMTTEETGGVAYGAHIGGFVAGAVFGGIARADGNERAPEPPHWARFSETQSNRVLW